MKATKFCKQKCCFLTFFCPADRRRAVSDKLQKASVKELVVNNSTNNSSSIILTRFLCSEIENTVFRTQKIVKSNITTQIKKLWLLALDLAKKKRISEGSKKSTIFLLSTWNLYLREIIFLTDVGVLTFENFYNRKKSSCLNRSFWNSFGSFISSVLKPLDIFFRVLKYAKKLRPRKR